MKRRIIKKLVIFGAAIFAMSCGGPDNEALRFAKHYYEERIFLRCGDSWFAKRSIMKTFFFDLGTGFVQVKDLGYTLDNVMLTEADKANGIEWQGRVVVKGKMFRNYSPVAIVHEPKGWSEWRSGFISFMSFSRVRGQWQVDDGSVPNKIDFSCSQIPG